MYIQIILLPFILFSIIGLFGRFIGIRGTFILVISTLIVLLIISILIFIEVILDNNILKLKLFDIVNIDIFNIEWILSFDEISSIMLIIILSISLIVLIYSYDYMIEDPHFIRFYLFIILFLFTMIILITTTSLPILFIGWEGVGLSSFLLISFWFTRFETSLGGLLALFMNRLGDIFFIIGIFMSLLLFGSTDIIILNSHPEFYNDILLIFFFLAAMTKSAQLSLHLWLPYSMEGPTPISALIHAATMVTAGILLLLRISVLLHYSYIALIIIIIIGSLTAFVGATLALISTDQKELIAYSTMSQLGYMITILGLKFFNLSYFHLLFHAYFKALLFLTAGSLIHTLLDIQDFRITGALINFIPFSYIILLIGLTSLTGLPFTTGFYSKEMIINQSSQSWFIWGEFIYLITLLTALITILYSIKYILNMFIKTTKLSLFIFSSLHYYSLYLFFSLFFLAIATIFIGFFWTKWNLLLNIPIIYINIFVPFYIKIIPVLFFILSYIILTQLNFYNSYRIYFLENQYGFKSLYLTISSFFLTLSYRILFKISDLGLIELLISITGLNIYNLSNKITNFVDTLNTNNNNAKEINYISIFLFSLFILLNLL